MIKTVLSVTFYVLSFTPNHACPPKGDNALSPQEEQRDN